MKKILSLISAITIGVSGSVVAVACGSSKTKSGISDVVDVHDLSKWTQPFKKVIIDEYLAEAKQFYQSQQKDWKSWHSIGQDRLAVTEGMKKFLPKVETSGALDYAELTYQKLPEGQTDLAEVLQKGVTFTATLNQPLAKPVTGKVSVTVQGNIISNQ